MQVVASHLQGPAVPMHTSPLATDSDTSTPGIPNESVLTSENNSHLQVARQNNLYANDFILQLLP